MRADSEQERIDSTDFQYKNILAAREVALEQVLFLMEKIVWQP